MLILIRLLLTASAVGAVGLAVLPWLVAPAKHRDRAAVRAWRARAAVPVAGCWAATAVVALWLYAAELAGRPAGQLGVRTVVDYATRFGSGAALVVTIGCAVIFGAGAATGRLPDGLLAVVAVLGLVPTPITGHAMAAALPQLAVVAVATHAVAAAAWVGGIGALVAVGPRRGLLAVALPRFSVLATWSLGCVAAGGVLTALAVLDSPAALVGTGYGRVVLAKTAILLAAAGAGLVIRRTVLPAVRGHRAVRWRPVVSIELALMVVALGLAAALTRLGP